MRALLTDKKKLKKTAQDLREKFVFLNVYCRSVKDEHDPRGPEGPYRFQDRSVPVVVIKKFDGTTLKQQLGWGGSARQLAQIVDKAVKDNGPVAPPRALRPLLKSWEKAQKSLGRKRIRDAVRELQKVVNGGRDKKRFKDGMPDVAVRAQEELKKLKAQGLARVEDAKASKKDLIRLRSQYGGIPEICDRVKELLKKLDG